MATHSVRRHLRVEIAAYDAMIRRFIPGYETMLEVVAGALAASGPDRVIDLGAGTGALSEAILAHDGVQRVELIDVDPEMLDQARRRLERFEGRFRVREMSFLAALPPCDGAAASMALHHVPAMDEKCALYGRIRAAIRPGRHLREWRCDDAGGPRRAEGHLPRLGRAHDAVRDRRGARVRALRGMGAGGYLLPP